MAGIIVWVQRRKKRVVRDPTTCMDCDPDILVFAVFTLFLEKRGGDLSFASKNIHSDSI